MKESFGFAHVPSSIADRVFWSIKKISEVLGMPWMTVKNILTRFRLQNFPM